MKCAGKVFNVKAIAEPQTSQGREGGHAPLLKISANTLFAENYTRSISAGDIRPLGNQDFRLTVFVH